MRPTQAGAAALCLATAAASLTATAALRLPDTAAGAVAPAPKPNVILIAADDLGFDQVTLNGGPIPMGQVNTRIANAGVRFADGYTASPVCSPSRTAILTGRHPSRVGNDSNYQNRWRPERVQKPSIAGILRGQGYHTKAVGKWDIAGFEANRDASKLPHTMGFQKFYGILGGISKYCDGNKTALRRWNGTGYRRIKKHPYLTNAFTDNAVDFIRNNIDKPDPYFLYLAYNAPHTPLQTPDTCPGTKQTQGTFADMVRIMNQGIGMVLDAAHAESSDTMVVFVSDDGSQFPQFFPGHPGLRGGKHGVFEGGVRVPFTMKWPAGLDEQGQVYRKPVTTLDLLPTIAAAGGRHIASDYPGSNLIPYLNGTKPGVPHQALYWRYVTDHTTARGRAGVVKIAIRSGPYKYVRHVLRDGSVREWLFDLSKDRNENNNLVDATPAITKRLIAQHNRWNAYNRLVEKFQHIQDNRPPDGFIDYDGTWQRGDGVYVGTADGAAGRSMVAGSDYKNASASADVRLATRGQAGLIVRGTLRNLSGYVVRLAAGSDQVILTRMKTGTATATRAAARTIATDTAYHLRIMVVGGTITVRVDGNQALRWRDPNPLPGGSIGLRVVGGKASFDQLRAHRVG